MFSTKPMVLYNVEFTTFYFKCNLETAFPGVWIFYVFLAVPGSTLYWILKNLPPPFRGGGVRFSLLSIFSDL